MMGKYGIDCEHLYDKKLGTKGKSVIPRCRLPDTETKESLDARRAGRPGPDGTAICVDMGTGTCTWRCHL